MNLLKSVKLRVEIFGCCNLGIRYDGIFQANLRWKDCWCSDLEPTPGAQVSPSRYAVTTAAIIALCHAKKVKREKHPISKAWEHTPEEQASLSHLSRLGRDAEEQMRPGKE